MAMNTIHRVACSSRPWRWYSARRVVPWALDGLDLGPSALEIGPGYGANVDELLRRTPTLTAVEIDRNLGDRLQRARPHVRVVVGDGTAMRSAAAEFSAVVCFTMLHHVPSPVGQDALFAEAFRVLRPGGSFAGSDAVDNAFVRALHIGDTYVPVVPGSLSERLSRAGFVDVTVDRGFPDFRFRARKPVSGRTRVQRSDRETPGSG